MQRLRGAGLVARGPPSARCPCPVAAARRCRGMRSAVVAATVAAPRSSAAGVKPRIAITCGDPAGIGPEVLLKAISDHDIADLAEITVFGSAELLGRARRELAQSLAAQRRGAEWLPELGDLRLVDVDLAPWVAPGVVPHLGTNASGEASFRFLEAAVTEALAGNYDAVVTGPVSKMAWHAAGHIYPGQTEYLAERAQAKEGEYGMMFSARSPSSGWQANLMLATAHIPLAAVPAAVTRRLLDRKLALLMTSLAQDFGYPQDRVHIAVAGLNPHSGECGQIGREEEDVIGPWLDDQRAAHPHAWLEGPVPPDSLWVRPGRAFAGGPEDAERVQPADAYLAMYHDQGLIPLKMLAFDLAVNFTAGLPFVRTSPDHGTAFDLEGGLADATSMKEAVRLAARIVRQRRAGAAAGAARGAGAAGAGAAA
ncbi:MAG: pyridoxal phosphate [Monoraphidium minutum]|nr:MAG: pyridoxal phosphate [Monoraphidium minutum]